MTKENLADTIEAAMDNVHDMDVTFRQYAEAAADAILAKLDTDALIVAAIEAAMQKVHDARNGEADTDLRSILSNMRSISNDPEARAAIKAKAGWSE